MSKTRIAYWTVYACLPQSSRILHLIHLPNSSTTRPYGLPPTLVQLLHWCSPLFINSEVSMGKSKCTDYTTYVQQHR